MKLLFEIISESESETMAFAKQFSEILKSGDIVELNGNLGTGKTFFVNAVCKNLHLDFTSSPTFSIVNEYGDNPKIFHFDFYRIEDEKELYDIGFEEYLSDMRSIIFIEWADLFPEIIPKKRYIINLEFMGTSKRKIMVYYNG